MTTKAIKFRIVFGIILIFFSVCIAAVFAGMGLWGWAGFQLALAGFNFITLQTNRRLLTEQKAAKEAKQPQPPSET